MIATTGAEQGLLPLLGQVGLRPLQRADEDAYRRVLHPPDGEDLRLRLGGTARRVEESCIRRFFTVDSRREEVRVALDRCGEIIGVGRLAFAPEAEIALIVRSDLKRRGVASALLDALREVARRRGISRLHGHVLAENYPMLEFARRHGFRRHAVAGPLVEVRLALT